MFEFICDTLHDLARKLKYECHGKHANIYLLSNIICYVSLLTMVFTLTTKPVGFQVSDRLSLTYLQCIMVMSKIKYEFFYLDFFILD